MNDGQNSIPFTPRKITIKQTSRRISGQHGVIIPIDRFAWLSDGVTRTIEKGLPLITESKMAHEFLDLNNVAAQIEQERTTLLEGFVINESDDEEIPKGDDSDVAESEEQLEYKKLHEKLMNKKKYQNGNGKRGTQVIKRPPSEDIIDNIGTINIKSAQRRQYISAGTNPFPPRSHKPKVRKIPNQRTTSALVKSQMKKVFKAGSKPFMNVDKEDDFPIDGLFENTNEADENLNETVESNQEDSTKEDDDDEDQPHQSLLLDPSEYDIFWTKNKVPFTREEVEKIAAWRNDIANQMQRNDAKAQKVMTQREKAIKRTFQSRAAFEKEMELTDVAMERAVNLGPCKSLRTKRSTWEISARHAKNDPSSLPYRRTVWNRICNQMKLFGGFTDEAQKNVMLEFRQQLVSGRYVSPDLFWESISILQRMDFISLKMMVFLEFLRIDLNVLRDDFIRYMDENNIPTQFYFLALKEIENQETNRQTEIHRAKKEQLQKQKAQLLVETPRKKYQY